MKTPGIQIAFLGVASHAPILPGQTESVRGRPQLPFRPNRLFVADESSQFSLLDIRVGHNSQFISSGDVPAAAFTRKWQAGTFTEWLRAAAERQTKGELPDHEANLVPLDHMIELLGHGQRVQIDMIQVGQELTTVVRNDGKEPAMFRAVYFGHALG